jgi:tRNA nucleotidyltransferase (CCA-adding enzyme)
MEALRSNESPRSIYKLLVCSKEAAELAWVLTALSPWASVSTLAPSKAVTKTTPPLATGVAREGIKLSNRMCETVTGAFRHIEEISRFKRAVNNREPWTREPDTMGMAIRRWDATGGPWKLHVLLAILVDAMRSTEPDGRTECIPKLYIVDY